MAVRWSTRVRDGVAHARGVALAYGLEFVFSGQSPVLDGNETRAICTAKRRALVELGLSPDAAARVADGDLTGDALTVALEELA